MGYKSSESVFQKATKQILAEIPGVMPMIDDVLVHGAPRKEDGERRQRVLQLLEEANAVLEPRKMELYKSKADSFGHTLTEKKIQPLIDNIKAIAQMPKRCG